MPQSAHPGPSSETPKTTDMKRNITALLTLLLTAIIAVASPSETVARADSAYSADDFALATSLYTQALKEEGSSSQLFYNLGNSCYREGNLGMAIVNYERALKLDPTNTDARTNLEFVNTRIADKQMDDGSVMTTLRNRIVSAFRADTWAMIAAVLFIIFIASAAVYVFSSAVAVRKASFFGGIIVFLITVAALVLSFDAANRVETDRMAIVLPPASQLSTSPREARNAQEQAFLLHEGTKVEIVDSILNPGEGLWYEVRVGSHDRAWIKAADLERI